MIVLNQPRALLLLPIFALVLWVWYASHTGMSSARARAALGVRIVLLLVIILGLGDLSARLPQTRQATVFVADLSASDAGSRSDMQAFINRAVQSRPSSGAAGVVTAGSGALVEQPVSPLSSFDGFQSSIDPNATNLESGLELAGAILPDGYRRRVVLLSDGQQNEGNALLAAKLLRAEGVRVDVVAQHPRTGPDVSVVSVQAPSQLHIRERFSVQVVLHSNVTTAARLDLFRDRTLVLSQDEQVRRGTSTFSFPQAPLQSGLHTYQVHITPAVDTQPQNNSGSAFVSVLGAPKVLVIAAAPAEAANVVASLRSTGIQVVLQAPTQGVPSLGYLQRYAAIVIVDTAAPSFDPGFLAQLVPYVRDLGRGLVVIGGQDAYGQGGYGSTPLEQVLPVRMDLPNRKETPTAAVALIIESLEAQVPVNISKAAGKAVVRLLTERDQIAVNDAPANSGEGWLVVLQGAQNKAAIDHIIDSMIPGDPLSYVSYLNAADNVLKKSTAQVKHIILLGDGDAQDRRYEAAVKKIRSDGITVSTVVTNAFFPAEFAVMKNIARWGGGRYYRADDQTAIPRIFLRETQTVAGSGVIAGKFYPEQVASSPILRDVTKAVALQGYIATAPKPGSDLVLVSKKLDPVLATWQYGLGRSVAWTSDAAGLWTRQWLAAPNANRFWANMVAWTFPPSQTGHMYVVATASTGGGRIQVQTPSDLGAAPDVTARVLRPDLHVSTLHLQPTAPGHYEGIFATQGQGTYFVSVEGQGAGHAELGQAGLDVPYSAEYRTAGANPIMLRAIARAGGGSIITGTDAVWRNNLATAYDQRSLTDLLWVLALFLLPVDIAMRRLVISRRDMARLMAAVRGRSYLPHPAPAPLLNRQPLSVPSRPLPRAAIQPARPAASPSRPTATTRQTPVRATVLSRETTASQLLAAKRRRQSGQ